MPTPKSKKQKAKDKPAPPPAAAGLPVPERVPQTRVAEVVQDFISFGGARSVEAHQENGDIWLVTATG